MCLVIECTRFNINWVFMFLSSVYLICHCQFFFSSLYEPRARFFPSSSLLTWCTHFFPINPHETRILNFSSPQAKWKARHRFSLSFCMSIEYNGNFGWGKIISIIQMKRRKDVGFWFILLLNYTDIAHNFCFLLTFYNQKIGIAIYRCEWKKCWTKRKLPNSSCSSLSALVLLRFSILQITSRNDSVSIHMFHSMALLYFVVYRWFHYMCRMYKLLKFNNKRNIKYITKQQPNQASIDFVAIVLLVVSSGGSILTAQSI